MADKLLVLTYEDGLENGGNPGVGGAEPYPERRAVDTSVGRLGAYSIKHEVRYTDPLLFGSWRCESDAMMHLPSRIRPTVVLYYGLSLYLPVGWLYDSGDDLLAQWKGFGGPPFMFLTEKRGNLRLRVNYNTATDPVDLYQVTKLEFQIAPATLGVWHDLMIRASWQYADNGSGRLEVRHKLAPQGAYIQEVDYVGPNMYNAGGYLKWGIYRPGWIPGPVAARVVYHDNVAIGTTWEAVDPATQTGP